MKEVREETQVGTQAETTEKHCILLYLGVHVKLTFSYSSGHLPRDGAAPGDLGTPTSISNQYDGLYSIFTDHSHRGDSSAELFLFPVKEIIKTNTVKM